MAASGMASHLRAMIAGYAEYHVHATRVKGWWENWLAAQNETKRVPDVPGLPNYSWKLLVASPMRKVGSRWPIVTGKQLPS